MKALSVTIITALLAASSLTAFADEAANKALAERIARDARTKADTERRAQAEANRDKTHDHRLRTSNNSSIGIVGGPKLDFKLKF